MRILIVTTALAASLGLLAACGQAETDGTETAPTPETTAPEKTDTPAAPATTSPKTTEAPVVATPAAAAATETVVLNVAGMT